MIDLPSRLVDSTNADLILRKGLSVERWNWLV
jgi:hypothetical protein